MSKYGFDLKSIEPWMEETEEGQVQVTNNDGYSMYSITQGDGSTWHFAKENLSDRITSLNNKKDAINIPTLTDSPTDEEQAEYDAAISKIESYEQSISEFQQLLNEV